MELVRHRVSKMKLRVGMVSLRVVDLAWLAFRLLDCESERHSDCLTIGNEFRLGLTN